jgi:hypothetical protein
MRVNGIIEKGFLAAILGFASASAAWSKPIDAPAQQTEAPMPLDVVTPALAPTLVEQLLLQAGRIYATAATNQPADQAAELFKIAERFRRNGDYAPARALYQRVHLLAPTTRFGRLAIDRLSQVEERMREAAEEQEAPGYHEDGEQSRHNPPRGTIPLGLVEVTY